MSYHVSNLGTLTGDPSDPDAPAYYADKDGFVPEPGDQAADFTSRSGEPYDPEHVGPGAVSWDEWVCAAATVTEQANAKAARQ